MRQLQLLVLLAALVAHAPARAAHSYDSCSGFIDTIPATVATPGVWCLRTDLSTAIASGEAITVAANNVTIDCNGFRLGGLAAGPASEARGVYSERINTTVRNCNIRGFATGVRIASAGGNLVEHNRLDGNLMQSIHISGSGSTVKDNQVFDTGGSTVNTNTAYAILVEDGTDVIANTVSNVSAIAANTVAMGITSNFNGTATIRDNRVKGVVASGSGIATGIGVYGSVERIAIRDNVIVGDGAANSVGIRCVDNRSTAFANVVLGYATGFQSCTESGNNFNSN